MKIVHIAPNAPYNDGWGFQDNLLPKYHVKMGHDVTLIITNKTHEENRIVTTECGVFQSINGFLYIRCKYVPCVIKKLTGILAKMDITELLNEIQPDFIFFHGLLSITIFQVLKYQNKCKKIGKNCVIVQDNHQDYNNSGYPRNLRQKLLREYYRGVNRISQRKVAKVYGVTSWRKQYAEDYYRIRPEKIDLLMLGADDEVMDLSHRDSIRMVIRQKFQIKQQDFLIVTGGKIDEKKNIHFLMEACANFPDVKLLIFGNVAKEIQSRFNILLKENSNIIYIGWVDSKDVYQYFYAADLACFPGGHSVLWEQACASKVPCLFAKWPGIEHLNVGGNVEFLEDIKPAAISNQIKEIRESCRYQRMKAVAESHATDIYLYSEIAKKTLEDIKEL